MGKQIYTINKLGFITDNYIGEYDKFGNLINKPNGDVVTTDLPQPLPFYKPKWSGTQWIEGATQEEIDELTKVEPLPPTEMELLKQRLSITENALVDLILGGI